MEKIPEVDPQALYVFASVALVIVGPFATEALKRWEVFRVRPTTTLALICFIVLAIGWAVVDRQSAHLMDFLAYSFTATGGGAVAYEGAKSLIPKEKWQETTGKIQMVGTGTGRRIK